MGSVTQPMRRKGASAQVLIGEGETVYPSYKDLDALIDVDRLRSLDAFVAGRLMRRIEASGDLAFCTGPFLLDHGAPSLPGSRLVYLARTEAKDDYYELDRTELWRPTPEADEFAPLMEFIATLPFEATGRMIVMYDFNARAVPAHRDHDSIELCHEFIWFRTNFAKRFYMLNPQTGEKLYVASHSAWFDTVNQYHGADAGSGLSFSIRVDGRFTEEFRRQIPVASHNPASAPALWAAQVPPHDEVIGRGTVPVLSDAAGGVEGRSMVEG